MPRPIRPAPTAAKRGRGAAGPSVAVMQAPLQFCGWQAVEAERLERARAVAQVAAEEAADDREQPVRDRRVDTGMARDRGEERKAEDGVLGDVAVRVEVDVLTPVARLDEL